MFLFSAFLVNETRLGMFFLREIFGLFGGFIVNPKIKASKNDNFQPFLARVSLMPFCFLPLFIVLRNFRF
jgi:hypothetical protein